MYFPSYTPNRLQQHPYFIFADNFMEHSTASEEPAAQCQALLLASNEHREDQEEDSNESLQHQEGGGLPLPTQRRLDSIQQAPSDSQSSSDSDQNQKQENTAVLSNPDPLPFDSLFSRSKPKENVDSNQKQNKNTDKRSSDLRKIKIPKKTINFQQISLKRIANTSDSSSNGEQPWFFLGDDDRQDMFYDQQEQDQDDILELEDTEESSSEEDSDDQEASDDSLPQDYDDYEDQMAMRQIFGNEKEDSDPEEDFIDRYELSRKKLQEEMKMISLQQASGIMSLQLQMEKELINQSTINFFNRNYLTFLNLKGGKKFIQKETKQNAMKPEAANENKEQDINQEQKITVQEKPKISKKKVAFRQIINMKTFKQEEQVTTMNDKEQDCEEINHIQKVTISRRIIPMSQQIKNLQIRISNRPKVNFVPTTFSRENNNKDQEETVLKEKEENINSQKETMKNQGIQETLAQNQGQKMEMQAETTMQLSSQSINNPEQVTELVNRVLFTSSTQLPEQSKDYQPMADSSNSEVNPSSQTSHGLDCYLPPADSQANPSEQKQNDLLS